MKDTVVFGRGSLAIHVAQWFLDRGRLLAVVPGADMPWDASFARWAHAHDVLTGTPWIAGQHHLGVSVLYDRLFSPTLRRLFCRMVNFHPGPLPAYRGCNPVNWALKNGETSHAVTIHEIDDGIDTGPILAEAKFPIYPDDEVVDLYERCLRYGRLLLEDTLPRLDQIIPRAQVGRGKLYQIKDRAALGDRADWRRDL